MARSRAPSGQAGRVGRLSPAATPGLEEWSSGRAARSGCTGSGLQTDFGLFDNLRGILGVCQGGQTIRRLF